MKGCSRPPEVGCPSTLGPEPYHGEGQWQQRAVLDGARAQEVAELYTSLGFEVRLEPAGDNPLAAACRSCLGGSNCFVVLTRSKENP